MAAFGCFCQDWDLFKQQHEFALDYGVFKKGKEKQEKNPHLNSLLQLMLHRGMNSRNFLAEETVNYEILPILKYWIILEMLLLCCSAVVLQLNFVFTEMVLTEAYGIQAWRGWKKMCSRAN